jgi:hypothetical protein
MRHGRLACVLAASAALAAPAGAHGAALQPLKSCYVSVDEEVRERMAVAGSGFTPNTVVEVMIDGEVVEGAVTDADGALGPLSVKAPFRRRGVREFTLTAAERGNPANSVSLLTSVAALSLRLRPTPRRARQRITWLGRGFTGAGDVYAHYVRAGKHRRTVRLGDTTGDCGRLNVERRQFPFEPHVGSWVIRVDQQKRWSRRPKGVFYSLEVDVARAR